MKATLEVLTIKSNPSNITKVESFVLSVVEKYNVKPEIYGNILISLTEAVTNAIIHGNQKDESKHVEVKLTKKRNQLAFFVSDQGPGFDFKELPDPTSPENILKVGGRGVFLMRQLSDKVVFYDEGSTVEINFNI